MSPQETPGVCPRCGYDDRTPFDTQYRAPGTVVNTRYRVGRLLSKNGESATYLGYDESLQKRVWIREYFPTTLALRDPRTGDVLMREHTGAQFKALMADFVDTCIEIKRLAVSEPILPIVAVLEDHGTAYAIFKDLQVVRLESWLTLQGGKLPVEQARSLLLPLLNSLSNIHARGIIHRGISPYTVYVDQANKLYLGDFCISAARTGDSELESELFNGYSAPEQYIPNGWQGTWTDVYAVAALFYRMVSGFVPPKSTMIGQSRPLAPLKNLVPKIPANISDAVADAMQTNREVRTREIGPFFSQLIQTDLSNTAIYDVNAVNEGKHPEAADSDAPAGENQRGGKYIVLGLLFTVAVFGAVSWMIMRTYFPQLIRGKDDDPPAITQSMDPDAEDPDAEDSDSAVPSVMPNLVGADAEEVMANQDYAGRFVFESQQDYDNQYEAGVIFDQSPPAGATVQPGRTVILYISKGARLYTMPNLIGMTKENAEIALQMMVEGQFEVTYTSFDKFSNQDIEPGLVISTTPAPDTEFDPREEKIVLFFQKEATATEASEAQQAEEQRRTPEESSQPADSWREHMTNPD